MSNLHFKYIPQNLEYTQNLKESPTNSQEHQKPERNMKNLGEHQKTTENTQTQLVTTKNSPKTIKEQPKTPDNTESFFSDLARPTSLKDLRTLLLESLIS